MEQPGQIRKHCHMTLEKLSYDIRVLQMCHEMFPSLATLSYDKVDEKFVARMFNDHQTFRVTFHVV